MTSGPGPGTSRRAAIRRWLPIAGFLGVAAVVAVAVPQLTAPDPDASPTPGASLAIDWINDLAGQLECDGAVASIGGEVPESGGVGLPGDSPEAGLANFLAPGNPYSALPTEGYTLLHGQGHWASFAHVVNHEPKAIIVLTDLEEFQRDGTGWLVIGLRACDPSEFDPDVPLTFPVTLWTDASGARVSTEIIRSFNGADHCGWASATFLRFDGQTYFRDPEGVMGEFTESTFEVGVAVPATAEDSGYRRDAWALWIDPGGDAYMVSDTDVVERWPRSSEPMLACR